MQCQHPSASDIDRRTNILYGASIEGSFGTARTRIGSRVVAWDEGFHRRIGEHAAGRIYTYVAVDIESITSPNRPL